VPAGSFLDREPELLERAYEEMPTLPVDDIDLLVIDEIGKEISGAGMDTNVIGRYRVLNAPDPETPAIDLIYVRGLTEATKGNGNGIGLADLTRQAAVDQLDMKKTYANALTSGSLSRSSPSWRPTTSSRSGPGRRRSAATTPRRFGSSGSGTRRTSASFASPMPSSTTSPRGAGGDARRWRSTTERRASRRRRTTIRTRSGPTRLGRVAVHFRPARAPRAVGGRVSSARSVALPIGKRFHGPLGMSETWTYRSTGTRPSSRHRPADSERHRRKRWPARASTSSLTAATRERLAAAKEEIEAVATGEVVAQPADLTDADEVAALVEATVDEFGTIDHLVTSAGGPPSGAFLDTDDEDWQHAFDLLVMSVVRLAREAYPHLKEGDGGTIVITSPQREGPSTASCCRTPSGWASSGWKTLSKEFAPDPRERRPAGPPRRPDP